jgi:hypothetical protein
LCLDADVNIAAMNTTQVKEWYSCYQGTEDSHTNVRLTWGIMGNNFVDNSVVAFILSIASFVDVG